MSLQLASPFQDHAVLQRDQPIPVWGWTTPRTRVCVTLAGNQAICFSNPRGDFSVRLPALPAGGPHSLKVELTATGESLVINDLLVGEVWLASGQSNMNWTLEKSLPLSTEAIDTADFPAIRFFETARTTNLGSQDTTEGRWVAATPESAPQFSAVAFIFARRLHRELGVPVGVLSSSWGGTFVQTWTSRSTLAHNPDLTKWLADYEAQTWTVERWKHADDAGPDGVIPVGPKDPGITQAWHTADLDDSQWSAMTLPANWQSAGHKHSGVFWFRRAIKIPADWIGRDLQLNLGRADKQDITYVNGAEVGRTGKDREEQYWSVPREYTIPAAVVTGDTLIIASRVYSFIYDGGLIGPAGIMSVHPSGNADAALPLAGDWRYRCEHDLGLVVQPTPIMGQGVSNSPHMLFDNMIQPLIPYALRGAIWYQGESNADGHALYARLMCDLIEDWRRQWGQPNLAFHQVQLPGFKPAQAYQPDNTWAYLREAQSAALALPNSGMAVIIDLGEAGDIHPINKVPVGERLAQSALARTYGRPVVPNGPLAATFTAQDGSLRITFNDTDGKLTTTDGAAPSHFYVAGEDRAFHPAVAHLDGTDVIVSCPAVPAPVAVRYAWADNPEGCNLAGASGLPASPFRSDRW